MFFIEGNLCFDLGLGDIKMCWDDFVIIISCEVVIYDFKVFFKRVFWFWYIRGYFILLFNKMGVV